MGLKWHHHVSFHIEVEFGCDNSDSKSNLNSKSIFCLTIRRFVVYFIQILENCGYVMIYLLFPNLPYFSTGATI